MTYFVGFGIVGLLQFIVMWCLLICLFCCFVLFVVILCINLGLRLVLCGCAVFLFCSDMFGVGIRRSFSVFGCFQSVFGICVLWLDILGGLGICFCFLGNTCILVFDGFLFCGFCGLLMEICLFCFTCVIYAFEGGFGIFYGILLIFAVFCGIYWFLLYFMVF